MRERTTVDLAGTALPVLRLRGRGDGPHVAVAGVGHAATAAVVRAVQELDVAALGGTVTAAPSVPENACDARTFGAETLLVLRAGGPGQVFAAHAQGERALALALGLPWTVAADGPGAVAAAGGAGLVEPWAVGRLAACVPHALHHLGLLRGRPGRRGAEVVPVCVEAPAEGWWVAAVHPGEEVQEGTLLGRIRDGWGDVVADVRSPHDGAVLALTTDPPVVAGAALATLGLPILGLPVA